MSGGGDNRAVSDSPCFQTLQKFIDEVVASSAATIDREEHLPRGMLKQLGEHGLFATQIDGRYAGAGYDPLSTGQLCESLGAASASLLSLFTVHSMVSWAIARWGSPEQRSRWLSKMASGAVIGAFALTEPEVGSDVQGVQTTLTIRDDVVVVRGTKRWISFGQVADVFLVVGKLDGKVATLLVRRETPGLIIEPIGGMLGFRGAMLAELVLRDCEVPQTHLIGRTDFALAQLVGSVLDLGRYCIAWGCVGLAQACLDATVAYTRQRVQFGRHLHEHQLVQAMIADMLVDIQAARLLCTQAARARTDHTPDSILATSFAKCFSSAAADRAAAAAVQIHGANGCSSNYAVERYLRDAKVMGIIEGTRQIQQQLIAQSAHLYVRRMSPT